MSLQQSDKEAAAVAKTPNRVSLADIEANIAATIYSQGGELSDGSDADSVKKALGVLTICVVVTHSGFTVVGKSAPADAANFDAELGRKFAREDCIRQLWPLMGFALREQLARGDLGERA